MSIEQFDLILCDLYRVDTWMPPLFGKWMDEYKETSYSLWAIDELRDFIADRLFPLTEGSIEEFSNLTYEFMMKMSLYSKVNPRTNFIFQTAKQKASDVLELLQAME